MKIRTTPLRGLSSSWMRRLNLMSAFIAAVGICTAPTAVRADMKYCERVLLPQIEYHAKDKNVLYSYAMMNSELLFEEFRRMTVEQQGASAAYRLFEAEYKSSKTASEFSQKLRTRLTTEAFTLTDHQAETYYRSVLSAEQLAAWIQCIELNSDREKPFLKIYGTRDVDSFHVKVLWAPQIGVGSGTLILSAIGGTVEGKTKITAEMTGRSELPFRVTREPGKDFSLSATIGGKTDIYALPVKLPIQPVRLLSGRLAKASALVGNANYVLDGNPGTFWTGGGFQKEGDVFTKEITIDLGKEHTVTEVELTHTLFSGVPETEPLTAVIRGSSTKWGGTRLLATTSVIPRTNLVVNGLTTNGTDVRWIHVEVMKPREWWAAWAEIRVFGY